MRANGILYTQTLARSESLRDFEELNSLRSLTPRPRNMSGKQPRENWSKTFPKKKERSANYFLIKEISQFIQLLFDLVESWFRPPKFALFCSRLLSTMLFFQNLNDNTNNHI